MVDKQRVSSVLKGSGISVSFPTPPPSADGDGNKIHNKILLGLPPREADLLIPQLEFVRLKVHHVLHEPGDTLKSAYFPNSGLVSILSVFPDGKCVEVGLVGREGFIGLPLVAGFRTANTRAIIQIEASGWNFAAEPDAGPPPATIFSSAGHGGDTGCGLQSPARSQREAREVVADECGSCGIELRAVNPGISCQYAWNAAIERHGGRRNA